MTRILSWLIPFIITGCGDNDTSGQQPNGSGCAACNDTELCVVEFDDAREERCESIPEVCNGVGACEDTECTSAMYDYCPDETSAWGCSDTSPPTFISCTL